MKLYTLPLLCVLLIACNLPTTTVQLPVREKERIRLGSYTILVHEYGDSLEKLARFRYFPVFHFVVFDSAKVPVQQYVGAWQEYLARFAGRLRDKQKEYIEGFPDFVPKLDTHYVKTSWRYPIYDGEISDLLYVVPVRNSYWSIDEITGDFSADEVYLSRMESVPQRDTLDPQRKRMPEFWTRILAPRGQEYFEMKKFLVNKLAKQLRIHADTAPAD